MSSPPVIIIGAGLSGLCCARELRSAGIEALVLEANEDIGGRVQTDEVDGFRLDRGFQVLQTAYPEAQRMLDYPELRLKPFEPGALIRTRRKFVTMGDPWRRPGRAWGTLVNGIGTMADRWRLWKLRQHVTQVAEETLWNEPDSTTADYLRQEAGLSADMVERFFRPWFSGVFFEDELNTSSRFFKFIFRMFALGDASLPADGMSAIPRQLAARLPPESVRCGARVESLDGLTVYLNGSETLHARAVVLAVEGPEAARISAGAISAPESRSTSCFYYAAPEPPIHDKLLVLNGDRDGVINHLCVPSNVAPSYAPPGQSLVSVSTVGTRSLEGDHLEAAVRSQLGDWFGRQVEKWTHLRTYVIRHGLPGQEFPGWKRFDHGPRLSEGLYCCGDYAESASIHGAMHSGLRAAEAVSAVSAKWT